MARTGNISSRRDYTFRYNARLGRHGWLRLTPAYSVRVVEEILDREAPEIAVFDPFSGTGTTALCAAERGLSVLAGDINPFLVWLGSQKVERFSRSSLRNVASATSTLEEIMDSGIEPVAPPTLHNIDRWWSGPTLETLCRLKAAIATLVPARSKARPLLDIAFCRTMISESSAAFNHPSMSFKVPRNSALEARQQCSGGVIARYQREMQEVLSAAARNPTGSACLRLDDARVLRAAPTGSFDVVVTSPPYPNRMSYIRELRPYMYWLGYLNTAREAGELDWQATGGTWGVATSRLSAWEAPVDDAPLPQSLRRCLSGIRRTREPSSEVLARYVHKYFVDMRSHLAVVSERIATGGRVHYVVGNSSFYGELVPTERIYAELLSEVGFGAVSIRTLRKRNSKHELFEFDVSAKKPH